MKKVEWKPSTHPISDIRDWDKLKRIEVRPDFQRRLVWPNSARIILIDTILKNIPMPKIFVSVDIREKDENTYRVVIDGQQRISAILSFLYDEFALRSPYNKDDKNYGKKFSQLDKETKKAFLGYQIDFNEISESTDEEVREIYSRVNKYNVVLNRQELRKAEFPGEFLDTSENLAGNPYFANAGIVTSANIRRSMDVEYVSEILVAMLGGYSEKKEKLDEYYYDYAKWESKQRKRIIERFEKTLEEIGFLFDQSLDISKTRFRQKSDFYTIFLVIDEFISEKKSITKKNTMDMKPLRDDLRILHDNIRPSSDLEICSDYAIKCVSQANSASSRRWRHAFIKSILSGTYVGSLPKGDAARLFYKLRDQIANSEFTKNVVPLPSKCLVCDKKIEKVGNFLLAWEKTAKYIQFSNAFWIHKSCKVEKEKWLILERPKNENSQLF